MEVRKDDMSPRLELEPFNQIPLNPLRKSIIKFFIYNLVLGLKARLDFSSLWISLISRVRQNKK